MLKVFLRRQSKSAEEEISRSNKMDKMLIEAAQKGDVHQLLSLAKANPFLLDAVALSCLETPLHIACMRRNLDAVKELLNMQPQFATELNHLGLSPLHIAAANGDLDTVKELLKIDSSLCFVKGQERRIPLHCAVMKGRIQVVQQLLLACPDSIKEATARGETSLHLAVKNYRFEALKNLAVYLKANGKEDIFNKKDALGNTVLHLAVSTKQYEVVELMLDENFVNKGTLEVNSLNKMGATPLDVLLSQGGDCEIEEILRLAGSYGAEQTHSRQQEAGEISNTLENGLRQEGPRKPSNRLRDYFKYNKTKDSPSKVRNTLLVIAVLIATATYQAVLNPPGGVWQDTTNMATTNDTKQPSTHIAGKSIMGTMDIISFSLFLLFNSVGFFMSISMLYFLTHGFPLQLELQVSLSALIATYNTSMAAILPNNGTLRTLHIVISSVMLFLMWTLTKLARDYCWRPTCVFPSEN